MAINVLSTIDVGSILKVRGLRHSKVQRFIDLPDPWGISIHTNHSKITHTAYREGNKSGIVIVRTRKILSLAY